MIDVKLIAIFAAAIIVFGSGYKLGGDSVESDWQREKIVQQQASIAANNAARIKEQYLASKLQDAQNAAKSREITLRNDANRANSAAASLRDKLIAIRNGLPEESAKACSVTASAAIDVFGQCAEEYRAMAEDADRHASDAMTLSEAWPD